MTDVLLHLMKFEAVASDKRMAILASVLTDNQYRRDDVSNGKANGKGNVIGDSDAVYNDKPRMRNGTHIRTEIVDNGDKTMGGKGKSMRGKGKGKSMRGKGKGKFSGGKGNDKSVGGKTKSSVDKSKPYTGKIKPLTGKLGDGNVTSNAECRHFAKGHCRLGDSCRLQPLNPPSDHSLL